MFPYLDLAGFRRRSAMPDSDVTFIETDSPGFVAEQIAIESSWINGRLRKRYGNTGAKNSLPLGQTPPTFDAAGTAPPQVQLTGRPTLGSLQLIFQVTTGGAVGTAAFAWATNGAIQKDEAGNVLSPILTTAPSVVLAGTGMSASFAPGTYSTDNVYLAPTPVPEIVLGWLTTLVTLRAYKRRGFNPQDPQMQWLLDDVERVRAEVKEAADSEVGLFDLPVNENADSAITTGGPLGCSDASPYAWQDRQARRGYAQDANQTIGPNVPNRVFNPG